MSEYRIKNWEKFQHYKNRNPPWIKLHRSIFDDMELMQLSLADRGLLFQLWVIATENDGNVPLSETELAWRLRVKTVNINNLITSGFLICASTCKQTLADDVPETEAETEQRRNPVAESDGLSGAASGKPDPSREGVENEVEPDPMDPATQKALFEFWQKLYGHGHAKFTEQRRRKLVARIREGYTLADCEDAIRGLRLSKFHMGDNDEGRVWDEFERIFKSGAYLEKFRDLCRSGKQVRT